MLLLYVYSNLYNIVKGIQDKIIIFISYNNTEFSLE